MITAMVQSLGWFRTRVVDFELAISRARRLPAVLVWAKIASPVAPSRHWLLGPE
jgi:hypothetical protein